MMSLTECMMSLLRKASFSTVTSSGLRVQDTFDFLQISGVCQCIVHLYWSLYRDRRALDDPFSVVSFASMNVAAFSSVQAAWGRLDRIEGLAIHRGSMKM